MSMDSEQLDMADLDDRDRDVLRALSDGRANPKLIRDETDMEKGDTNTVLVRLGRAGLVRQVTRGLYEVTDEGREEIGEARDTTSIDVNELRRVLDDIEAACERGDGSAVQDAIRRAREVLDDA